VAVLWVLHRELAQVRLADTRLAQGRVSGAAVLLALAGTVGSYLALTGYDVLALRYLGRTLPYPRVALASFVATAVGHNLGMAMLSAGATRLRFYTAWGLSATEVGRLAILVGMTFGVGVAFAAGLAMLLEPAEAGLLLHLADGPAQAVGGFVLAAVSGYLVLGQLHRKPLY